MSDWTIEQMRDAVARHSAFVVGNATFAEVCDYIDLPETDWPQGPPSQESVAQPDGYFIDVQTANAIVTVHDALSEKNRAKLLAMPIGQAASVVWELLERTST
jgi:hypothetical protein